MAGKRKKILIAVDGSDPSMAAVRYAAGVLSPAKARVTLFHVKSDVPETFLDQQEVSNVGAIEIGIPDWTYSVHEGIEAFMENSSKVFSDRGFDPKAVETVIKPRETGYARDILFESSKGYAALVFGRAGFGRFDEVMLGSMAAKLVESARHLPVVVVGGGPETRKVVVAFDKSAGAGGAVACIESLFDTRKLEVTLCHIVRPLNLPVSGLPRFFKDAHESDWVDANTRSIVPLMADAKKRLMDAGVKESNVSTVILKEKTSRAKGVFDEAVYRGAGTIVAGRRGMTEVREFSMGRVSRKILHLASDMAFWIA